MTYSINVRPYNDPYIKTAEEAMEAATELVVPGPFLVDIIPIFLHGSQVPSFKVRLPCCGNIPPEFAILCLLQQRN